MNQLKARSWSAGWGITLLLGLFAGLSGCQDGGRGIPKGTVSGTVTFQGKPVTEGVVNLSSPTTGIATAANLNEQGEFLIVGGLEEGSYVVSIAPPPPEEIAGAPPSNGKPKEYPDLPVKYRNPKTSGFTATIVKGTNKLVFEMQ